MTRVGLRLFGRVCCIAIELVRGIGPHWEFNRTATPAETKFADQEIGLLTDRAIEENVI